MDELNGLLSTYLTNVLRTQVPIPYYIAAVGTSRASTPY